MSEQSWDEPAGATPRGTLVLLPGRGETPASYQRFGWRLAADAYKVRFVDAGPDNLTRARAGVEKLLADETLPSPKVLIGADTGATFAAMLVNDLPVDAVVVAGIALPGEVAISSWDQELDARTACPVHRQILSGDGDFHRGEFGIPLPWTDVELSEPAKPVLVLHGTADAVTASQDAIARYSGSEQVRVRLVDGGRHDILNDVSHRSVAATIVLFLESLRLAPDLPDIVLESALDAAEL